MPKNMLITKADMTKLLRNGAKAGEDHFPVIKLFNPVGAGTWLISEIDPENPDMAFGLADLGHGYPELGSISISEIATIRLRFGMKIERDQWFRAKKSLVDYADEAQSKGKLVA